MVRSSLRDPHKTPPEGKKRSTWFLGGEGGGGPGDGVRMANFGHLEDVARKLATFDQAVKDKVCRWIWVGWGLGR